MIERIHQLLQRGLYPELARFPNRASRNEAWSAAHGTMGIAVCGLAGMFVAVSLAGLVLGLFRRLMPWIPFWVVGLPAAAVAGFAVAWLVSAMFRKHVRRRLRQRLNEVGIPVCLGCGYDLRGQEKPRCPECGCHFDSASFGKATSRTHDSDSGRRV